MFNFLSLIGILIIAVVLILFIEVGKKESFTESELSVPIGYYPDNLEQCEYFCDYFETVNCPWNKGDCSELKFSCLSQCAEHVAGR